MPFPSMRMRTVGAATGSPRDGAAPRGPWVEDDMERRASDILRGHHSHHSAILKWMDSALSSRLPVFVAPLALGFRWTFFNTYKQSTLSPRNARDALLNSLNASGTAAALHFGVAAGFASFASYSSADDLVMGSWAADIVAASCIASAILNLVYCVLVFTVLVPLLSGLHDWEMHRIQAYLPYHPFLEAYFLGGAYLLYFALGVAGLDRFSSTFLSLGFIAFLFIVWLFSLWWSRMAWIALDPISAMSLSLARDDNIKAQAAQTRKKIIMSLAAQEAEQEAELAPSPTRPQACGESSEAARGSPSGAASPSAAQASAEAGPGAPIEIINVRVSHTS